MGEGGQIKIRREIGYIILVVDMLFQMRTVRIRPEKNSLSLFKINVAFIRSEFLLFFHHTPFVSVIDIQGESLFAFTVSGPDFFFSFFLEGRIRLQSDAFEKKCCSHSEPNFVIFPCHPIRFCH